MSRRKARPAGQSAPPGIEPEGRYLQRSDGSWFVVGADGWPVPMDEYLTQLRELGDRRLGPRIAGRGRHRRGASESP